MQVIVLIAVLIVFILGQSAWTVISPPFSGFRLALAVCGYLLVTVLLACGDLFFSTGVLRRTGGATDRPIVRHKLFSMLTRFWLLGGLAGIIALGYKNWIANDLGLKNLPLLGDLLLLAPFIVALMLVWLVDYPFHRAMRVRMSQDAAMAGRRALPYWSRWEYIAFNTRHYLLFILVPLSLIILCIDSLSLYVYPLLHDWGGKDIFLSVSVLLAVGGVFLLAPVLIVRIWKTSPLPSGPLRDQLETMCRRMGVRCRNILIWESGGVLANAGAMGFIGSVRYLLLSDALLNEMPIEHIRAVFAHEIGHIRSRHIPYFLLFAIASVTLCLAAAWGAGLLVPMKTRGEEAMMLFLWAWTWAVGFGYISKRFERQSDVIGAWASGPDRPPTEPGVTSIEPIGAEIFAEALQQVAWLNGVPPSRRNWRHGRISDRIDYIRILGHTGGTREEIDRLVRRIKVGLWLAVLAGLGLTVLQIIIEGY